MASETLLKIDNVSKSFGGLTAVKDYSLDLPKGKIYGLIGPNGAGKTTIFNLITGILKVSQGKIYYKGTDITNWRPDQRARMGINRNFQTLRLFKELTVLENVKVSRHMHLDYSLLRVIINSPKFLRKEKELTQFCEEILSMFELVDFRDTLASELPYGHQRKLDIVRAVVTGSDLILLDEPSAGMNSIEAERLSELLTEVWKKYSLTIVIVEHRMPFVLGLSEHVQVLDHGMTIAEGPPQEIRHDPIVIQAYLGRGEDQIA